jgi:hypothetical protein
VIDRGQLVVGGERHQLDGDIRDRRSIGLEAVAQRIEVGQSPGIDVGVERIGEFRLAGLVMGERKQAHHRAAGAPLAILGQQRLERADIGAAGEQLVAVDQVEQRHWLFAQRVDDVPVVDDVSVLVARLRRPATPQGHDPRRAEKAVEPIIVDPHTQAMADEPGRHRVEYSAQNEAAARRDRDGRLLVIGGAPLRQLFERGALYLDALAVARIAPSNDLVDETIR